MLNDKQQAKLDRLCKEYEWKLRASGCVPNYLIRDWVLLYRTDMYVKMLNEDKPECAQHRTPAQKIHDSHGRT